MLVCERGTMFGYSDLVVDPRNFVLMRDAACPVTADVTHALQQPAGRTLEARTPGAASGESSYQGQGSRVSGRYGVSGMSRTRCSSRPASRWRRAPLAPPMEKVHTKDRVLGFQGVMG